ncbi:hypothetical protein AB0L41_42020 [Amycolatopsis mediterranei]|uniref:hypothetical protein n=1 Tax=Amycolatopsis mediterranei TaxID=33910 RepID=UPI0034201198
MTMLGIDVRSSRGEKIRSIPAHPKFDPVLAGIDRVEYPILGHLDPYGATVLNGLQVATLVDEISRLQSDSAIFPRGFSDELIALCQVCLARPHRFLWFIGE